MCLKFFSKESQHLIDFVQLYSILAVFQFPDKPDSYPGSFCQLDLGQPESLPLITNMFSDVHNKLDY